jgi:hypothetical protein
MVMRTVFSAFAFLLWLLGTLLLALSFKDKIYTTGSFYFAMCGFGIMALSAITVLLIEIYSELKKLNNNQCKTNTP